MPRHPLPSLFLLLSIAAPLPVHANPDVISWTTPAGASRLAASRFKSDFFLLANYFQIQPDKVSCGLTTAAIILNALRLRSAAAKPRDPHHIPPNVLARLRRERKDVLLSAYTPATVLNAKTAAIKPTDTIYGGPTPSGKPDWGLQLRQLHRILLAHGLRSTLRVVNSKLPLPQIRRELRTNLRTRGDYVIVNYYRPKLAQPGGGHFSPLGAYHRGSDSFLIMDVNPHTAHWVWVKAAALLRAMRTFDTVENRGYLLVSDSHD